LGIACNVGQRLADAALEAVGKKAAHGRGGLTGLELGRKGPR